MLNRRYQVEGYFSVEAALLLPMVILFMTVMIFMAFYSYDRCILEQSAWQAAIRGSYNCFDSNEAAQEAASKAAQTLVKEKLFAVSDLSYSVKASMLYVEVSYDCKVNMPFITWLGEFVHDKDFSINVTRKVPRCRQTEIVRLKNKN